MKSPLSNRLKVLSILDLKTVSRILSITYCTCRFPRQSFQPIIRGWHGWINRIRKNYN